MVRSSAWHMRVWNVPRLPRWISLIWCLSFDLCQINNVSSKHPSVYHRINRPINIGPLDALMQHTYPAHFYFRNELPAFGVEFFTSGPFVAPFRRQNRTNFFLVSLIFLIGSTVTNFRPSGAAPQRWIQLPDMHHEKLPYTYLLISEINTHCISKCIEGILV